jgi:excisionase family DNA binding protein
MRVGTAKDVSALLLVSVDRVYELAAAGDLPTLRKIGPQWRFDLDQVERWFRDGEDAA